MKALFDITHPAHAHFFKNAIRELERRGWSTVITSRRKECATDLLDELGFAHRPLSALGRGGAAALLKELVARDLALRQVVRETRPDVMLAIGGTFIAHVGKMTGTPSLVFYDTENARLQNAVTYPFATLVAAPRCYRAWLPKRHLRYAGYHELAYLHPAYFKPDRAIAQAAGLAVQRRTFLVRIVSWKANHDIGERGWPVALLRAVIAQLSGRGKVIISAEGALPQDLEPLRYAGRPGDLHHLLAFCSLLVGESATLSSEAAVLGVPSIYAAQTGRGYTDEQEREYGLVRNFRTLDPGSIGAAIDELLREPAATYEQRRQRLLADTVDVTSLIVELAERHAAAQAV